MNKINLIHDILLVGDIHLEEDSIDECFAILDEIIKKYPKDMVLVQLGDLTDKNKLNAVEVEALTEFTFTLAKHFKKLIFIDGNHSKLDKNNSIINYLRFINDNVEVYQDELAIDYHGKKIVIGHYFLDKSNGAFGDFRHKLDDLETMFDYGFFGHQHDFQDMSKKKKFYHLGSARYTSFGEHIDSPKYFGLLTREGLKLEKITSLTELADVYSIDELEITLNHAPNRKIRYIIKSFEQLKAEMDTLKKYRNKFKQFKIHNDFMTSKVIDSVETKEQFNSKEMINTWINQIEDKETKELLTLSFKDVM